MEYKFLQDRGALAEGKPQDPESARTIAGFTPRLTTTSQLSKQEIHRLLRSVSPDVVALIPESFARENTICAIADDGETLTVAATNPNDLALQDKLRFMLNRNVRFVAAAKTAIQAAIDRNY